MKLSESEITYLIEVDASISGRVFVGEDESTRERQLREKLLSSDMLLMDDDHVELTDLGRKALAENE